MNSDARNYLLLLVKEILEEHTIYSNILSHPSSHWTLDEIVRGVQATIRLKGDEMDDGYNPDLDNSLRAITAAQDGTLGTGGHYIMFSVVCQYIVDEIGQ